MKRSIAIALVVGLAACGSKNQPLDIDAAGGADAAFLCAGSGAACTGDGDCCSLLCDVASHTCTAGSTMCAASGAACAAGPDCCSGSCVNLACSSTQCVSDNATCANDSDCCSGMCSSSKTCTPLNSTCKTTGNACNAGTDCCSGFCNGSKVCAAGSYCTQNGDACAHDADCCGGICNLASNGVGTCSQPTVGATNCSAGIDGTLCQGCGDCCSRLCGPYGPTGVMVCQPAEGCRIDGDLCQQDSDCCGAKGSGLPGDGNVQCIREHSTDPVGICRNPMSCDPEGDVCHFKNYNQCDNSSARNDCCGGQGNSGVCQLDPLGVPRCYGLGTMCRMMGQTCASSVDCCNGAPCVPNAQGILQCGATGCVSSGGSCSATADCCNGATCTFPPGSTMGTCGAIAQCEALGQACSSTDPCCTGEVCNVSGADPPMACPDGQTTGCVCQVTVF